MRSVTSFWFPLLFLSCGVQHTPPLGDTGDTGLVDQRLRYRVKTQIQDLRQELKELDQKTEDLLELVREVNYETDALP